MCHNVRKLLTGSVYSINSVKRKNILDLHGSIRKRLCNVLMLLLLFFSRGPILDRFPNVSCSLNPIIIFWITCREILRSIEIFLCDQPTIYFLINNFLTTIDILPIIKKNIPIIIKNILGYNL